ncbi:hypothetical protein DP129_05490 [Clostridium tetani]|uniref:hypothetical protein n=1 Tax=Clostridium tetani TaxID=1513 RepID=UPI00100B69A5|nr:hypothetical protein [Clostridium tetani]RXI40161.1 hypothetical protein DP129_05490 [Clostridium tetani]
MDKSMSIRNLIKTLLDIEVNTEGITELRENPREYVNKDEDVEKLRDLFLLMDLTGMQEVD